MNPCGQTELKRAQLDLASTTQQLVEALRVGQVGSIAIDLTSGTETMSEEARIIFGFDPGEPCDPASRLARIHPDDRIAFHAALEQTLLNGTVQEGEFRITISVGSVRHIYWRRMQGMLGSDGQIAIAHSTIQDFSSRKIAELQVIQSKKTLRIMLDTVPIGIGMTMADGEIIQINSEAMRLLGSEAKSELVNSNLLSIAQNSTDMHQLF